jgi:hypothetical protein
MGGGARECLAESALPTGVLPAASDWWLGSIDHGQFFKYIEWGNTLRYKLFVMVLTLE